MQPERIILYAIVGSFFGWLISAAAIGAFIWWVVLS